MQGWRQGRVKAIIGRGVFRLFCTEDLLFAPLRLRVRHLFSPEDATRRWD
jgi:hypothetical protein